MSGDQLAHNWAVPLWGALLQAWFTWKAHGISESVGDAKFSCLYKYQKISAVLSVLEKSFGSKAIKVTGWRGI